MAKTKKDIRTMSTRQFNTWWLKNLKEKHGAGTLKFLTEFIKGIDDLEILKREKLTMADFLVLANIAKEMTDYGGGAGFISESVKIFLEKHGFETKTENIGFYVFQKEVEHE